MFNRQFKFLVSLSLSITLLTTNCTLLRSVPNKTGGKEEVIKNCVDDFVKTRLFRNGTMFSINFYENFRDEKLIKQSDNAYKWLPDKSYPNIFAVSIVDSKSNFLYNPLDTGKFKTNIPNCILWKNGKLFYWHDEGKQLTESTINTFKKLGLIVENFYSLEFTNDDSKKAVDYFICKTDISNYKRKVTNVAIGYYKPPELECK